MFDKGIPAQSNLVEAKGRLVRLERNEGWKIRRFEISRLTKWRFELNVAINRSIRIIPHCSTRYFMIDSIQLLPFVSVNSFRFAFFPTVLYHNTRDSVFLIVE